MTQIFFPEGIQPSSKITEIPGGAGGYDTYPWDGNSLGVGSLKQKCLPWKGGMDIFWNYTIFAENGLEVIRHRIGINMKKKNFSHFIAEKIISRMII